MKTRSEWLLILRRCHKKNTLDKVTERAGQRLTGRELVSFLGAADHRLAELTMQRLFDRVPAVVWTFIR